MNENIKPEIWYDEKNPALYKKLTEKEIFEWLQSTNEFIWKALTKEQRLENKIKELYKA